MNAMATIDAALSAGELPTYEQLEAALAECLTQRNYFETYCRDMGEVLSSLAVAFINKDSDAVGAILDAFVKERVVIKPAGKVH